MKAPRVLVAGAVLGQPMGGVRRHNAELLPRLARLLDERGGGLAVLEGKERIRFELGAPVERLASRVPARPALARAAIEGHALRAALDEAAAHGRPFDLVHTAHLPAPRRLPVPFTLTLHDLRSLEDGLVSAARRVVALPALRDAVLRARSVFTVSASTKAAIVERLGVPAERVRVVPNAGDHFTPLPRPGAAEHDRAGVRPRRADPAAPSARGALLGLGHVEPRKNLALVLRALAADPELPPLVCAGAAKGGHADELAAVARSLGVAERVRFAGPFAEDELARLLSECAAVVLPSRVEGFGIVALEAQRARAPLAIARIPALVEVAGPGVPSFDPEDAAECALALRAVLARGAAELERDAAHAARFTWDASAAAWCDALCALHAAR